MPEAIACAFEACHAACNLQQPTKRMADPGGEVHNDALMAGPVLHEPAGPQQIMLVR
jgi:hypothetical protein